jgi:hypothetical protein
MKLNELEDFPKLGNTIVLDGNIYVKKQEPLSDEEISLGREDGYDDRFIDGVIFAEKMHGIGGK